MFILTSSLREQIINICTPFLLEIMQNPFGNYFIQTVIQYSSKIQIENLSEIIINESLTLCTQKYSSNCIIKLVEFGGKTEKKKLLKKLFFNEKITVLLKNKHVKNVILKCINLLDRDMLAYLIKLLENNVKLNMLSDLIKKKLTILTNNNIKLYSNNNNDINKDSYS